MKSITLKNEGSPSTITSDQELQDVILDVQADIASAKSREEIRAFFENGCTILNRFASHRDVESLNSQLLRTYYEHCAFA